MGRTSGKGWHGDREGHAYAGSQSHKRDGGFNWLPLLLIPLFFVAGWGANEGIDNRQDRASSNPIQYGVGGGPGQPCIMNEGSVRY